MSVIHASGTRREALAAIGAGAAARDADPAFPHDAFAALARAGALVPAPSRAEEWATVRAVAAADGSVGRLYEGHLNAVERLLLHLPAAAAEELLADVARGERLLGVWGADPAPGEGEPARVVDDPVAPTGLALLGDKVFCSGAGGLHAALVTARAPRGGPPWLVLAALDDVEVDRSWYRASGMRASESHRVVFRGDPVLAVLGEPGELVREPWLSGDAIRTAAAWAGMADAAASATLDDLAARPEVDDLRALAAGRIVTATATIDAWFAHAAAPGADLPALAAALRASVAEAGRVVLEEAGRALGSRPFATGSPLDRVRRDLELFALQHRLDPVLARAGRAAVEARR